MVTHDEITGSVQQLVNELNTKRKRDALLIEGKLISQSRIQKTNYYSVFSTIAYKSISFACFFNIKCHVIIRRKLVM